MRTLELLDDVEALVQLREDVGHRTGEQHVLRRLLKLHTHTPPPPAAVSRLGRGRGTVPHPQLVARPQI